MGTVRFRLSPISLALTCLQERKLGFDQAPMSTEVLQDSIKIRLEVIPG